MTTDEFVVFITVSSNDEAEKIAKTLVDEHLAACVNVLAGLRSFFFWDGKTQQAMELLLIAKTRSQLIENVIQRVRGLHSYTVPEIIAVPIAAGFPAYLEWIRQSTKSNTAE